jgi:hypothetical protein
MYLYYVIVFISTSLHIVLFLFSGAKLQLFLEQMRFWEKIFCAACRDDLQIVSPPLALMPTMYTIGDDVHIISTAVATVWFDLCRFYGWFSH